MERYLMYLRKSRMDTDFDEISVEETLNRHRRILESFCKERRLNVVDVLEEVVSGESLSSRPKMLRLLELVNTGMYAGVICIDIERLSRGSSLESGYIMQVLQTNNCKIITPSKIYDLQNESDEQFTDMKFMFSRYELKTITKRLVRGRNQSASEGKFLGSVAPYGYRAYKLVGMKGNSLRIEPKEAKVVRMIFDMYGKQGIVKPTQLVKKHEPRDDDNRIGQHQRSQHGRKQNFLKGKIKPGKTVCDQRAGDQCECDNRNDQRECVDEEVGVCDISSRTTLPALDIVLPEKFLRE